MKQKLAMAAGATAIVLVALWLLRVPEPEPLPERVRTRPAPIEIAKTPVPPAPKSDGMDAGSVFRGHGRVAEALDGVAIRCEVGRQLDGTALTGGLGPRVQDGWFSTVVPDVKGSLAVGGKGQPATFQVHWEAEHRGASVPCTVEWLDQAMLAVEVIDGTGKPGVGLTVRGCGVDGATDAEGRVSLQVPVTGRACWLTTRGNAPPHLGGEARIEGLEPGEERAVVLYVDPRPKRWEPPHQPVGALEGLTAEQLDARAARMEELAAEGGAEEAEVAEVMGATLRRRAELKRVEAEQDALLDEMKQLTDAFRSGEREALEDLDSLTQDLLDNARRKLELSKEE